MNLTQTPFLMKLKKNDMHKLYTFFVCCQRKLRYLCNLKWQLKKKTLKLRTA